MRENMNLKDVISSFGETELVANRNFKKYKERCSFDPYGVLFAYEYRAKLSDITTDFSKIKTAFLTDEENSDEVLSLINNGQFIENNIYVLLSELSFSRDKTDNVNIYIPGSLYVSLYDTENNELMNYRCEKDKPACLIADSINEAEDWLERWLTPANIEASVFREETKQAWFF